MIEKGHFAEYIGHALWTAYGPLVKTVGGAVLIVVVVIVLAGFWSKVSR
jgi:putative Mn2+ efflux pump MntP